MHTDLPLQNSDDDQLGRFPFATQIASGLVNSFSNNNDSIVMGINGTWGTGKSTLINFIIQEIERISQEKNEHIISLHFNPWMFSGQHELQKIFLSKLFMKLGNDEKLLKQASEKIADILEYLEWIKNFHSGAGTVVSTLKGIFKKASKKKELSELKKEVDELLIKAKVKLYITIDDIDRLTPSEITDIFQMVKLNGNFANTIFILAYDRDVVTAALNKQFGNNGDKYVEKIVQIDFTLPAISGENIKRIFADSLLQLFPEGDIKKKILGVIDNLKQESFVGLFSSIRDIYRFTNSIKLRFASVYNDLNITEFFIVEALRIFEPNAYDFIIQNKDKLIYKKDDSIIRAYNLNNNQEETAKSVIDESIFTSGIKNLLSRLFEINTYYFQSISQDDLIREKRVANRNYFDRYFNLQLGDFDIKELTFDKFINSSSTEEKVAILEEIHKKEKLYQFLQWVEMKSKNSEEPIIEEIIYGCFTFTDSLPYSRESFYAFDSDFMSVQRFCSRMLSKINGVSQRQRILLRHITNNEKNYSFSSFFTADSVLLAKKKKDEGELGYDHMWNNIYSNEQENNDDEFLNQVKDSHKESIRHVFLKELENKGNLEEDELFTTLLFTKQYYSDLYDEHFASFINDDKDLVRIIWICMKNNYVTVSGASQNNTGYRLSDDQLLSGLNKDEIKNRFESFDRSLFDDKEKKVINLFLKAYEDGFIVDRYYNIETLEIMKRM